VQMSSLSLCHKRFVSLTNKVSYWGRTSPYVSLVNSLVSLRNWWCINQASRTDVCSYTFRARAI